MKLSGTEEVVAKQLYSLRQQNKVEGLFIYAASVLDTIFQEKKWNSSIPFSQESPHSSLALAGGPASRKDNPVMQCS